MTEQRDKRGVRKQRTGIVVSEKMDKTIIVNVERKFRHGLYSKVVTRLKRYHAHDEENKAHVGDRVRIVETRPVSRLKRWRLIQIIK